MLLHAVCPPRHAIACPTYYNSDDGDRRQHRGGDAAVRPAVAGGVAAAVAASADGLGGGSTAVVCDDARSVEGRAVSICGCAAGVVDAGSGHAAPSRVSRSTGRRTSRRRTAAVALAVPVHGAVAFTV